MRPPPGGLTPLRYLKVSRERRYPRSSLERSIAPRRSRILIVAALAGRRVLASASVSPLPRLARRRPIGAGLSLQLGQIPGFGSALGGWRPQAPSVSRCADPGFIEVLHAGQLPKA